MTICPPNQSTATEPVSIKFPQDIDQGQSMNPITLVMIDMFICKCSDLDYQITVNATPLCFGVLFFVLMSKYWRCG